MGMMCLILRGKRSPKNVDETSKKFENYFKIHRLKITTVTNAKVINVLDVTLDFWAIKTIYERCR